MKIRMLTGIAGVDHEGREYAHSPGDEVTVDDATAKRLLDTEQAEAIASKPAQRAEKRTSTKAAAAETR